MTIFQIILDSCPNANLRHYNRYQDDKDGCPDNDSVFTALDSDMRWNCRYLNDAVSTRTRSTYNWLSQDEDGCPDVNKYYCFILHLPRC